MGGRRPWRCVVAFLVGVGASLASAQTTYHVRPDGGSASQCTGLVNAPYPGSGSGQPCAWNHPFQALPPGGSPRIAGGDTLLVGAGSYMMGYGAPGADACDPVGSWDCLMSPVPSGPDPLHPTRILGAGWDSGCPSPPELWGSGRPWFVVNLSGSSNLMVACLEITDHSVCIENHNQSQLPCTGCNVPCERDTPPYGDWAAYGLYAEDSSHVTLRDLSIHGLASGGLHAGRLSDWTLERVRLVANGAVGWDGDLWGPSSNSGDMILREVEVAWNGCAETWPGETVRLDTCWGQQAGGYGDGIGLTDSEGHWVLEDLHVHHNTSDGVDLLYLVGASTVEVRRLVAEGNAGNQLKTAGPATVENSLLIGSCSYFSDQPLFQGDGLGDNCRASGGTYSIALFAGQQVSVVNTTFTGEGDCLMDMECRDVACNGTESVEVRNTLFFGHTDWFQPWENTCLYYYEDPTLPPDLVDFDYNLVWQVKDDLCPGANSVCLEDPLVVAGGLVGFDGHLTVSSPAVDAGTPVGAPPVDLEGTPRDALPDIGAYELASLIFADDFELGTTTAWTVTIP